MNKSYIASIFFYYFPPRGALYARVKNTILLKIVERLSKKTLASTKTPRARGQEGILV
jgi:hypothetical protein